MEELVFGTRDADATEEGIRGSAASNRLERLARLARLVHLDHSPHSFTTALREHGLSYLVP